MNSALQFDYDQTLSLIKQSFGSHANIQDIQGIKSLQDYQVLLVRFRHTQCQVIIKLAGPKAERHSQFDRTAKIVQRVQQETGLPVPQILAYDISFLQFPFRYLIQEFAPGIEWAQLKDRLPSEDKAHAFQEIGDAVARIHQIKYPSFGEIQASGQVQGSGDFLTAFIQRSFSQVTNPYLHDVLRALFEKYASLFSGLKEPCLCHEDLHQHNLLFRQEDGVWQLAAILDFDKCWAGKNEIDLARMAFWHEADHPEFWKAYLSGMYLDPEFESRKAIFQLIWCLEFNQTTPSALSDTRQLCQALDLPFRAEAFGR